MYGDKEMNLSELFLPVYKERLEEAIDSRSLFIRYTGYDRILDMVKFSAMPMSHISRMNDNLEITYGADAIIDAFTMSKERANALNEIFIQYCPGHKFTEPLVGIREWLSRVKNQLLHHTNIVSFCQLRTKFIGKGATAACLAELQDGCSLMWQSYGKAKSAAIVFDLLGADAGECSRLGKINVDFSPVSYLSKQGIANTIDLVLERTKQNLEEKKCVCGEQLNNWLTYALVLAMASIKHPAFHHEREWRLIHFSPNGGIRKMEHNGHEAYEIPLWNRGNFGGLSLQENFKR